MATNGHNRGGFTLMELLIVVAIIAVLVAIAIPLFTTQLEKARESVDEANSRSAMAVAAAGYMDGTLEVGVTYYYDLSGFFTTKPDAYGRGTQADGGSVFPDNPYGMTYDSAGDYTQSVIVARLEEGATYPVVKWDKVGISVSTATGVAQVINGLRISNFWSEANGNLGSTGVKDLQNLATIEAALTDAGYDINSFSYQRTGLAKSDEIQYIYVTLEGRLTTADIGQTVRVVRYAVDTGEAVEGTAVVTNSLNGRADVGVSHNSFQAD